MTFDFDIRSSKVHHSAVLIPSNYCIKLHPNRFMQTPDMLLTMIAYAGVRTDTQYQVEAVLK